MTERSNGGCVDDWRGVGSGVGGGEIENRGL